MEMIMYTKHAKTRMQQRGIDPLVVDLLLQYGVEQHDNKGGVRRFFNKMSRKELRRSIGRMTYRKLEHYWDAYLIEAGGQIVTVGWRH